MKYQVIECAGCKKEFEVGPGNIDEDGLIDLPTEQCKFCEDDYCSDRCYKAHDCPGHDAEIVICLSCEAECEVVKGKNGYLQYPAIIDGDPACAKCAYLRPWEKKKVERREVTITYFDKAS